MIVLQVNDSADLRRVSCQSSLSLNIDKNGTTLTTLNDKSASFNKKTGTTLINRMASFSENLTSEPMGTSTPVQSRQPSGPALMTEDDVDRDFWNLVSKWNDLKHRS